MVWASHVQATISQSDSSMRDHICCRSSMGSSTTARAHTGYEHAGQASQVQGVRETQERIISMLHIVHSWSLRCLMRTLVHKYEGHLLTQTQTRTHTYRHTDTHGRTTRDGWTEITQKHAHVHFSKSQDTHQHMAQHSAKLAHSEQQLCGHTICEAKHMRAK